MDTQGFVTVHHKRSRKRRDKPRGVWTWADTENQPAPEGWAPQTDIVDWRDDPPPPEDEDPPTALTLRNLKKWEPQCEFHIDRLHYWIPFWRDCVALALEGRQFPQTTEFYDRLYEEVGRMGRELNGGYGPYIDTGFGCPCNQWGNISDAGWKGGNGWGWGKRWVDPVDGQPWNTNVCNWIADNTPADDVGWNDEWDNGRQNGWNAEVEHGEQKPAPKKGRRRRPAREKRSAQDAAEPNSRVNQVARLVRVNGRKE